MSREPLTVPDAAVDAFFAPYSPSDERERIERMAAPVVAAELRRLAGTYETADGAHARIVAHLRARADELHPGGA